MTFLHFFDISEMQFYWYPVHKSSGSLWSQKIYVSVWAGITTFKRIFSSVPLDIEKMSSFLAKEKRQYKTRQQTSDKLHLHPVCFNLSHLCQALHLYPLSHQPQNSLVWRGPLRTFKSNPLPFQDGQGHLGPHRVTSSDGASLDAQPHQNAAFYRAKTVCKCYKNLNYENTCLSK